jgi:predicted nuclease with TOPRIM domain
MRNRQISKLVEKINNQIKEKKGKLAPLIKELRQVRTDFSQLESEYNEKKSLYESTGDFLKIQLWQKTLLPSPVLLCC